MGNIILKRRKYVNIVYTRSGLFYDLTTRSLFFFNIKMSISVKQEGRLRPDF